jgi:P4 family phage/plasmid primase-like protien
MTTLQTLRSYLDSRRTQSADWNVTGMGVGPNGWTGKYAIPDDEYDTFLRLAHDHVFRNGRACSLLEKHKANGPILIDLDFRYPAGGPLHRRFTQEQVREFVAAYADAFARFFEPVGGDPLQFFVMLKPAPEADPAHDQHKDGVHIVCPTITLPPETQYAIRGWLLQTNAIQRVFGSTGMINEPTDCLDVSVIARNNWFLYGACKPDKAWYKVEHVYGVQIPEERMSATEPWVTASAMEEESMEAWDSEELVRLLSIRHGHDSPTPLTLRTDDPAVEAEWIQLLQRWGKGSNWAKPKSPGLMAAKQSACGMMEMPSLHLAGGVAAGDDMIQVSGMSVRSGYSTQDIALAYRLVRECLNPEKRCGDYQDWVSLALCLKNIADTDESLAAWTDITRRTGPTHKKSRLGDAELRAKWRLLPADAAAMQRGRKLLLMGTLHLWAKEDAPVSYRSIISDANREMAILNDSGTHVSIAEQIYHMYQREFRCTPARKGATAASMDWYQFDGHTWRSLKTMMTLRLRLSNEVRNVYIHADREVGNRITMATADDERQRLEAKRKNLLKVESQLQNCSFKDSVMKEAAEKFYDEEFLQHMNMDSTLVGFSNGVLELRHAGEDNKPHICFRPGRPDDCISFQMGRGIVGMDAIPYIPYDPDAPAPEHLEIQDFFRKIYPDPVLREYALTLYSACLEGANHEQKFYIMSGSGGNGKSKIIDLMSKTFGEYQEALPVTALTRKRADAGSANPEMIVLKCRRFVSMVEPEEGEKINTSLMKQLSGQDTLKARGLFQDQDQFVVMARIFMSCNDLPAVSSMDEGTWRRLRVIPHVSTFVEEGKPTNPAAHIYARDPLLDSKITRWRPFFAGMLAWYYENKYLRGGLHEPPQVNDASRKYKEENDAFAAFCQDCLLREVGAEVRTNDILVRYKEWIRFNPGKKVLNKKDIVAKMTEAYGQPIDGGRVYVGVRIAEEGEDVSGNVISSTPGFSTTTVEA